MALDEAGRPVSVLVIAGLILVALVVSSRASEPTPPEEAMASTTLVPIRFAPSFALDAKAEAALARAVEEAGQTPRITSAYRTREQQAALYDAYKAGRGNLAAPPGRSFHELGLALDARGGPEWEAAMSRNGWRRTVASEPWHWEFRP